MLFGIQPGQDLKLGNGPKGVSIVSPFQERLNAIVGVLVCSASTCSLTGSFEMHREETARVQQ
jgi:hypothetical protein